MSSELVVTNTEITDFLSDAGAEKIRAVIADFYTRVFQDLMIGFFFKGKNQDRLIQMEWEMVMRLLGNDIPYSGRPMEKVHRPLKIFGGHFDRRYKLLEETLVDHPIPKSIQTLWLNHIQSMRAQITGDPGDACAGEARKIPGQIK